MAGCLASGLFPEIYTLVLYKLIGFVLFAEEINHFVTVSKGINAHILWKLSVFYRYWNSISALEW